MNMAKYLVLCLFMEKVPIFQLHSLNFANLGEMMKAQANILIVLIFVHFFVKYHVSVTEQMMSHLAKLDYHIRVIYLADSRSLDHQMALH